MYLLKQTIYIYGWNANKKRTNKYCTITWFVTNSYWNYWMVFKNQESLVAFLLFSSPLKQWFANGLSVQSLTSPAKLHLNVCLLSDFVPLSFVPFSICHQKRLFIDPYVNTSDPVECDLLFNQLIEDVFQKRIPINHNEAVRWKRWIN